jgi:hypothetical protein
MEFVYCLGYKLDDEVENRLVDALKEELPDNPDVSVGRGLLLRSGTCIRIKYEGKVTAVSAFHIGVIVANTVTIVKI